MPRSGTCEIIRRKCTFSSWRTVQRLFVLAAEGPAKRRLTYAKRTWQGGWTCIWTVFWHLWRIYCLFYHILDIFHFCTINHDLFSEGEKLEEPVKYVGKDENLLVMSCDLQDFVISVLKVDSPNPTAPHDVYPDGRSELVDAADQLTAPLPPFL